MEFHWELIRPATDTLSPINVITTRGTGITAASSPWSKVYINRLKAYDTSQMAGTRFTHHLFPKLFRLRKSSSLREKHSESLHHAFAQCGIFATAASRRTWILVSESISRLPLSRPVPIIALPGFYPSNRLIGRSLILGSVKGHSSTHYLSDARPQFPGITSSPRAD